MINLDYLHASLNLTLKTKKCPINHLTTPQLPRLKAVMSVHGSIES